MNEIAQDLPGLDLGKLYKATERLPDVSKDKQYTAERLKAERPDVYEIARRLFFECGMTKRGICEICRINFRTLGAIIEREILSHGAEFLYKKTRLKKSLITYQLTERIEELATDDAACRTAGINGLVAALKTLHELKEPVIDAESSSNNSITSTAKSDYEQIYESIESNGLGTEKKSAACEDDSTASNENGEQIELASPTDADAIIAQKHSVSQRTIEL